MGLQIVWNFFESTYFGFLQTTLSRELCMKEILGLKQRNLFMQVLFSRFCRENLTKFYEINKKINLNWKKTVIILSVFCLGLQKEQFNREKEENFIVLKFSNLFINISRLFAKIDIFREIFGKVVWKLNWQLKFPLD